MGNSMGSSKGFKLVRVGLIIHVSLFKDLNFVTKYPRKRDNSISTCLISLNIISYYSYSLNNSDCLICQIYQKHCNWLKIHCIYQYEMMNYDQQQKLQYSWQIHSQNSTLLLHQMVFHSHYTHTYFYHYFLQNYWHQISNF